MDYEKELSEIKNMYARLHSEREITNKKLAEYDTRIAEQDRETINPEIRQKVEDVYLAIRKAYDRLTSMEEYLKKNNLLRAFETSRPNFPREHFLEALRDNYMRFAELLNRYCEKGAESPEEVVRGMAQCYRNVVLIRTDLESLLETYIREKEVKAKAISVIRSERSQYVFEREEEDDKRRSETLNKIKELNRQIEEEAANIDRETIFTQEPKVEENFSRSFSLVIGRATDPDVRKESFPDLNANIKLLDKQVERIAFTGNSNILIRYTPTNDEDPEGLYDAIKCILTHFALSYPAYFKRVCAIHQRSGSELIRVMSAFRPNQIGKLFFLENGKPVENEPDGIRNLISELCEKVDQRASTIGSSGENDILAYNTANNDNAEPLILLVIKDYPRGFDNTTKEKLKDLLRDANKYGIFLLLVLADDNSDDTLNRYCKNVYSYRDGILYKGKTPIEVTLGMENFSGSYYAQMFQKFEHYTRPIPFADIHRNPIYDESDFSRLISIPFGKEGAGIVTLSLSADDSPHCVVAGTSGSGKSSLLYNIVLGGAKRYSPEELEFWIIDLKNGTGFSRFSALNHVTMMALTNNPRDSIELLNYLDGEMQMRTNKFKEAGTGDNIARYNAKMKADGKPMLPRLIVIIDEYTEMEKMPKCINILAKIAKQGRSAGIVLAMSSQQYSSAFSGTVDQVKHCFEFDNNRLGYLINDAGRESGFLKSLPGNVLYSSRGKDPGKELHKARVAYAKEEEQLDLIKEINEQYPCGRTKPLLIMGKPNFPIRSVGDFESKKFGSRIERDKENNSITVTTPIGETRLGKKIEYMVNGMNPLLLLFGNEKRLASVEYSILRSFTDLLPGRSVYYCDISNAAERSTNVMLEWSRKGGKNIRFARTAKELMAMLLELEEEFNRRIEISHRNASAKQEEVGDPIEFVIHVADEFLPLLKELPAIVKQEEDEEEGFSTEMSAMPQTTVGSDLEALKESIKEMSSDELDASLDLFFNAESSERKNEEKKSEMKSDKKPQTPFNALNFFHSLYAKGKDIRMYLIMQFSNMTKFHDGCQSLFGQPPALKDVIIIPERPRGVNDACSTMEIRACLNEAKQSNYAALYAENEDASEFEYAIVIDESTPTKILPYEWKN